MARFSGAARAFGDRKGATALEYALVAAAAAPVVLAAYTSFSARLDPLIRGLFSLSP